MSLLLDSADRSQWQEGTDEVDGPDAEASSVLLVAGARAGIGAGFEAKVSAPYAWMNARDAGREVSRASIGDLLTEIRWVHATGGWTYGLATGAYWPLGELGAEGLPATATFSTGTVDPTIGAQVVGPSFRGFGWALATNARLILQEQEPGRRLGSSITSSASIDRRLADDIGAQLQLIHFHRGKDEGNSMEATGGDWLYLAPSISYELFAQRMHGLQVTFSARIPLVQDVEGRQLVDSTSLNVGLGYTVEF